MAHTVGRMRGYGVGFLAETAHEGLEHMTHSYQRFDTGFRSKGPPYVAIV